MPRSHKPNLKTLAAEIGRRTRSPQFRRRLADLLVELCRIDTTPNPDVSIMRHAEAKCFEILQRELAPLSFPGARTERRPINPAIRNHPAYSLLHFTRTARRPGGLSAEATYAGRSNLLYFVPGTGPGQGQSIALNAHLDVVAPYFPPRHKGGAVYGRGACDDKGPVVSILAAFKVLAQVMANAGLNWNRNVLAMFVVEEETGGNGSLSLAIDRKLKRFYDSILVSECTGLKIHPANRGAVWYRAELAPPAGVSAFEMFAFVNEELEKEGAAIRAESRHPLFPQRPVQTCHGIIGPFGEHPSRICGEVSFLVQFERQPEEKTEQLLRDCLEAGLARYVGLYGDKTRVTDPATGKAMVERHYNLQRTGKGFQVDVHGATGHMGAIRERDGAITKMAHLLRSLLFSKAKLAASGGPLRLELAADPVAQTSRPAARRTSRAPADLDACAANTLVLEGGQGFVPTHRIDEIMERLRQAAQCGAEIYLRRLGRPERGQEVVTVSYEKLHNLAFDGQLDSPAMRHALAAARLCGLPQDDPVLGWTVSCDARIFAGEYPQMPVLTFGPGQLAHAHSDQEQITLEEIRNAAEFLAVFLLRQTGTAEVQSPKSKVQRQKAEG